MMMWKMILYTATGLIFTEAAYYLYKCIRKKNASDSNNIAEVIWTNELGQKCYNNHFKYINGNSNATIQGQDDSEMMLKCDNPYCAVSNMNRIVSYLDSAEHCIDLAMYTFSSLELSYALQRALRRGVIVRIITDKEMAYSTGSQVTVLMKNGAPVRFPISSSLMHHKFCVIDDKKRVDRVMKSDNKNYDPKSVKSLLLNGSLNWTLQGFNNNWENISITSESILVNKYEEEFERMWIAFDSSKTQQ